MIERGAEPGTDQGKKDLLWPVIITVLLGVVIAVNAAFIFIAVKGADDVDPAYVQGER
jgi:hypothetical protein